MAFGRLYAKYYDSIYSDKNYEAEVDYIERILKSHSDNVVRDILDISCGTGGHTIPLAKRGYSLTALDSSRYMLAVARRKSARAHANPKFFTSSMTSFKLDRKFDACISMFDSVDYLGSHAEVEAAFTNVRQHLNPGGLFIFQFWNGIAVLAQRPGERIKVIRAGDTRIIRYAHPTLHPTEQKCEVEYHTIVVRRRTVVDEFKETHVVLFLFPQEVSHMLANSGFLTVGIHPFMKLSGGVGEGDWSVTAIAKYEGR